MNPQHSSAPRPRRSHSRSRAMGPRRLVNLPLALLATTALLAGCQGAGQHAGPENATHPANQAQSESPAQSAGGSTDGGTVLDRLGVADADAVAIIDALDRSEEQRPLDIKASVRSDRLVLTDTAGERSLPIPSDTFYLSVAPYLQTTHECFAHSLSGCQGEQVGKPVHITITDSAGAELVDEQVSTWRNGFVGFWLPSGIEGTVSATMDGKTGSVPFATNPDSPTCLTTLQLR